jgi:hypothetical protein
MSFPDEILDFFLQPGEEKVPIRVSLTIIAIVFSWLFHLCSRTEILPILILSPHSIPDFFYPQSTHRGGRVTKVYSDIG